MFLLNFTYVTLPKLKFSTEMHVASVLDQYALEWTYGIFFLYYFSTVKVTCEKQDYKRQLFLKNG